MIFHNYFAKDNELFLHWSLELAIALNRCFTEKIFSAFKNVKLQITNDERINWNKLDLLQSIQPDANEEQN